jgi:hypothetical protein
VSEFHWDPVEHIVNKSHLRIVDPGPLRVPITSFSLRRDETLELILETETASDAKSKVSAPLPGMLRHNTDTIRMANDFGLEVVATGVQPLGFRTSSNHMHGTSSGKERCSLHSVEAILPGSHPTAYTIDWLENVHDRGLVWPHVIEREKTTVETRLINRGPAALTIRDSETDHGAGADCVKLQIGEFELYLCSEWIERSAPWRRPGCIIYVGTPAEETQKRIREVLSFSLGMYLVSLGYTVYSDDWRTVSFKSVSPYAMYGRVFDLSVMPPAPLAARSRNEIEPARLSRITNALYSVYDELGFGDLNWGFWHARCATPHIAAVHFGAIIEALRKVCAARYGANLPTKLIEDGEVWRAFSAEVNTVIAKLKLPGDNQSLLREAVGRMNSVPHQVVTAGILSRMKLQFSEDEMAAWRRRNDAAHGRAMEVGTELTVISETKLLRGLFDRMLLKLTDASEMYYDYASLKFPIRQLAEAPSETLS